MRLDKIHIRNYRGFEDLAVELNPQFNLVIGDNGAGKTSFLDACAVALSSFLSGIDNVKGKGIKRRDIHIKTYDGQPRPQTPVLIETEGNLNNTFLKWDAKVLSHSKRVYTNHGLVKHNARDLLFFSRKGKRVKFPLIIYHGTGRLWQQAVEKTEYFKQLEGVELGYKNCLSQSSNNKAFISWYKTYADEIKKFDKEEDKVFLNVFNSTVSSFVKEWTDMAYSFKTDELIGFMTNENGEKQYLSFNQLSDGYRNVIGMVADMTYRCIQLNPHLKENVVKETEGVVLIDELDLHLHPNWQRDIVADLKRVFPKVQFIATSHSPFIIQSLKKEELINLDTNNIKPDEDPFKQSIEDVAEDIMQVEGMPRSNEFNEMIQVAEEYYGLLKQGKNGAEVANLRERLTQLETRYSDDAAFVALLKAERASTNL